MICTVLGSSAWATAGTEPLSASSGAASWVWTASSPPSYATVVVAEAVVAQGAEEAAEEADQQGEHGDGRPEPARRPGPAARRPVRSGIGVVARRRRRTADRAVGRPPGPHVLLRDGRQRPGRPGCRAGCGCGAGRAGCAPAARAARRAAGGRRAVRRGPARDRLRRLAASRRVLGQLGRAAGRCGGPGAPGRSRSHCPPRPPRRTGVARRWARPELVAPRCRRRAGAASVGRRSAGVRVRRAGRPAGRRGASSTGRVRSLTGARRSSCGAPGGAEGEDADHGRAGGTAADHRRARGAGPAARGREVRGAQGGRRPAASP